MGPATFLVETDQCCINRGLSVLQYGLIMDINGRKNTDGSYKITRAGVCKTLCPQLPDTNTA